MSAPITKKDLWDATWNSFKAAQKVAHMRSAVIQAHASYDSAKKGLESAQNDHMKAALRLREVEELLVAQSAAEQPTQQEIAA